MFFVTAAMLVCSMLAFGQGFSVAWYETDQPLTDNCSGGNFLPDGTVANIHQDINGNGNADWNGGDPLADVGGGVGQVNYNTFPLNGCSDIGQCGTFATLQNFVSNGNVPANARYYIVVHGGGAIWRSNVVTLTPGPADIELSQWDCEPGVQPCQATPGPIVLQGIAPQYACVQVCGQPPSSAEVVICGCPPNGAPIVTVFDGCDRGLPGCTIPCPPGHAFFAGPWVFGADGCWHNILVGELDGCVCICWDGCEVPPCQADPEVAFFGANSDPLNPIGWPAYYCAQVCEGFPLTIRVCSPDGLPFDPSKPPIFSITPDCNDDSRCFEPCDPLWGPGAVNMMGLIPSGAWAYAGNCWVLTVIGTDNGCVCLCFDGFLAAEIASFAAAPRSASAEVTLVTRSETDISRFEVSRAIKGHETFEVVKTFDASNLGTGSTYSFVDEGLRNGTTYAWTLRSVDISGHVSDVLATTEATPSLDNAVVTEWALLDNYPNPFNPTTQISFDVLEDANVSLKVFNAMGQEVATVVNGTYESGRHTVTFDAGNLTSGLYFYTVKMGDKFTATKKMLLVK
jgi:hypothetical protein